MNRAKLFEGGEHRFGFSNRASGLLQRLVLAAVWLSLSGVAYAAEGKTLEDIQACARRNLPETSYQQHISLNSSDASGGQRSLVADLFGLTGQAGKIKLMLSVKEPSDLAGARYLLVERASRDDMYVYLPAMKRTRRIIGGMRGQPLWGTDFSYEDIKHLQGGLGEAGTEYLRSIQRDKRAVHQLQIVPLADAESPYQRIELDLDDRTCLVEEARFFDAAGLVKRMTSDPVSFQKIGERWMFAHMLMQDLRNNSHSSIDLTDIVYDERIALIMFNPKSFHLAR